MVGRNHLVEAKLIKELPLISVLPPHHRRLSCRLLSRNHCSLGSSSPFSTASAPSRSMGWRSACRLLGVDLTRFARASTAAVDPQETFGSRICCDAKVWL